MRRRLYCEVVSIDSEHDSYSMHMLRDVAEVAL